MVDAQNGETRVQPIYHEEEQPTQPPVDNPQTQNEETIQRLSQPAHPEDQVPTGER